MEATMNANIVTTVSVPLVSPFSPEGLIQFHPRDTDLLLELREHAQYALRESEYEDTARRNLWLYMSLPNNQVVLLKDWKLGEDGTPQLLKTVKYNTAKRRYRLLKIVACELLGFWTDYWVTAAWHESHVRAGRSIRSLASLPLEADYLRNYANFKEFSSLEALVRPFDDPQPK
jgi:hypothetical protein